MGLKSYKIGEEDPAITHAPGMGGHNSMTDGAQLFEASAFEALIIKTTLPWARKKWPVAAANLQHYINNTGTLRTMDMKKMLSESLSAKQNYESELAQAIKFVESLDTGTYDITSSTYSLGGTHDNPNWYYAIGVYKGWGKGRASVFCVNKEKDKYWYSLNFTYKMSDYYNWHRLKSAG